MLIRPIEFTQDVLDLYKLIFPNWATETPELTDDSSIEDCQKALTGFYPELSTWWGCFDDCVVSDTELIGLCLVVKFEKMNFLSNFGIDPDFQEMGMGTLFMSNLSYQLNPVDTFLFTPQTNLRIIQFYQRQGFEVCEGIFVPPENCHCMIRKYK